jgi:hypothetical protein
MKKLTCTALLALIMTVELAPQIRAAELPKRPSATAAEVWHRTELYFGTSKSNGSEVSDAEFAGFVDQQITPRFPDGLTLLTGYGQFRNSAGVTIREKSLVLILFYPPQTLDANKKVQEIREEYKRMFSQESVLRVDSFSIISF